MAIIRLQPKQAWLDDLVNKGKATWIGVGGGRGGAKSAALQRVMLRRRNAVRGTKGVILMRNFDQVQKYHVAPMLDAFPELYQCYHKTENKITLPNKSEIHFSYAESMEDVIRRFRSANYYDVFIDQAEQFVEQELREIKQCVRWPNTALGTCKLVMAFNMGGVGIDFLRKKFHFKEFNKGETERDFAFIHVNPWDNVEWVRPALEKDGISERSYYEVLTEQQRKDYCATRGDYGRNLVSQDEPLKKRDWEGSWESLEGAYFARVFDRESSILSMEQEKLLIRPWWKRWLSQDWGRGHFCSTHWHASGEVSPEDFHRVLGWEVPKALRLVVTYREYIAGGSAVEEGSGRELAEEEIAAQIVKRTPLDEQEMVRSFFLSPDAFAKRQSSNTIAMTQGLVLRSAKMVTPSPADDDRKGGWGLMYNLLLNTKRHGEVVEGTDTCWMIGSGCPELINALPLAMRDPKDLDDVLKTDKGTAKLEQDVLDDARYGLKTMLAPGHKPRNVELAEKLDKIKSPHAKSMYHRAWMNRRPQESRAFRVH